LIVKFNAVIIVTAAHQSAVRCGTTQSVVAPQQLKRLEAYVEL